MSELGRESGCKPEPGDISATEGGQTRTIEERLRAGPSASVEYGQHLRKYQALYDEAATAIASLREERERLRREVEALRASQNGPAILRERVRVLEGALNSCESWIDRWTYHIGSCKGEDHRCTCGRAAVLHEARAAIAKEQT